MGGKNGSLTGISKPEDESAPLKGIAKDEKGQEQPADKARAQQAGLQEQKDAAQSAPESPGEPANGE